MGGNDPFDGVWLRLSTAEPGTCRIVAQPSAVETSRATPAIPKLSPAVIERDSLAYFTTKRLSNSDGRWELGANGHGPQGAELADRIAEQRRVWDRDRAATPTIKAFPADTPDDHLPQAVRIDKHHTRLTFCW